MSPLRVRLVLAACVALLAVLAGTALGDAGGSADRHHQHAVISAGGFHTCAVDATGAVRCWGADDVGQLGDGEGSGPPPVPVQLGQPAVAVAAGSSHTCALLADGTVRCWGSNTGFALGIVVPGQHHAPVGPVPLDQAALAIAAGSGFTCALLGDGSVRCWGANGLGQLTGLPGPDTSVPAAPVALGRPARAIAAGEAHACALLDDGAVRCWGAAGNGRLGDPDPDLLMSGAGLGAPVGLGRAARAIDAGPTTTCALLDDGAVRCWGGNEFGQLGDGGPLPGPDSPAPAPAVPLGVAARGIAVGSHTPCALLADDTVRCWGRNHQGQLGAGGPVPGADSSLPAPAVALGQPARALTAGGTHACALVIDGSLRCWGGDLSGQLGDGPPLASSSAPAGPVDVPAAGPVDSADVSLTAAASAASVQRGRQVTITLTLANAGVDAAAVTVGTASTGLGPPAPAPSQGSFAAETGRWSAGTLAPGASATLTLVATATGPGTATLFAGVASSASDPDAAPGGVGDGSATVAIGVMEPPPPGGEIPAPPGGETPRQPGAEPSPTGKVAPGQLTLRLVPDRDPKAPYVFAARGRLIIPGAAGKRACSGAVTVTARRGKRPALVRRAKLQSAAGACNYSARLAFARRPARQLKVTARFAGNARLRAKSSRTVTALLGPAARRRA